MHLIGLPIHRNGSTNGHISQQAELGPQAAEQVKKMRTALRRELVAALHSAHDGELMAHELTQLGTFSAVLVGRTIQGTELQR